MSQQKETESHDKALLKLLYSAKSELQGMRLIHMHLSLLKEKKEATQSTVRSIIDELGAGASYFQSFNISNGDVIVLYKGLRLTSVTDVCRMIEGSFLSKTELIKNNPYSELSLYTIKDMSVNIVNVTRFMEELENNKLEAKTKPPITLIELDKLERSISRFDMSSFLFNQPIISLDPSEKREEYLELYISIKLLQEQLCPDYSLMADPWLFNYFTSHLDLSVLRVLKHDLSILNNGNIGINTNLSTVMSNSFIKFDESLPVGFRGKVVLEIAKSDLVEDLTLFQEVVEFAQDRQYMIAVDRLNPFWAINFDLEYLNVDYAKIFWSPEFLTMDQRLQERLFERINQGRCQFILARCDTAASLMFADRAGIKLVQGRMVDMIQRNKKGGTIGNAIAIAKSKRADSGS